MEGLIFGILRYVLSLNFKKTVVSCIEEEAM